MKYMKWIACALAFVMTLLAFSGSAGVIITRNYAEIEAPWNVESLTGIYLTLTAVLAVVVAWLGAKLEKPVRTLGGCMAAFVGISLAVLSYYILIRKIWVCAEMMKVFLLIMAMLIAIIWLVGGMIRRQLEKEQ